MLLKDYNRIKIRDNYSSNSVNNSIINNAII